MRYKGFFFEPKPEGASYTCPECSEVLLYGLQADPDAIDSDIDSHNCDAEKNWRARCKRAVADYNARKRAPEAIPQKPFTGLTQAQIDARTDNGHKRSDTINARLARLMK